MEMLAKHQACYNPSLGYKKEKYELSKRKLWTSGVGGTKDDRVINT